MNLRAAVAQGLKSFRFSTTGQGAFGSNLAEGLWTYFVGGSDKSGSWANRSSQTAQNGVVIDCLTFILQGMATAKPVVYRVDPDGNRKIEPNHHGALVIAQPNPWYDWNTLIGGVVTNLLITGNAYIYKLPGDFGNPVGLIYIPSAQMSPIIPKDGSSWISGYSYIVDGKPQPPIPVEDVIHIRMPVPDSRNPRLGKAAITSEWQSVMSDAEVSTYSLAILRNVGIAPVLISPKAPVAGQPPPSIPREKREQWKDEFKQQFTGEGRGDPLFSSLGVDVSILSFSPEQLALDKLSSLPIGRICAALRIDPMCIGLPSEQKTYSNFGEARKGAWENTILPLLFQICGALTHGLMPDLVGSETTDEFGYDLSQVQALQEDVTALYTRVTAAVGGPWLSPNDARRLAGVPELGSEYEALYPARTQLTVAPPQAGGTGTGGKAGIGRLWHERREAFLANGSQNGNQPKALPISSRFSDGAAGQ